MSFYSTQEDGEVNGGYCLVGDRNGEKYNIRDDRFVLDFFKENSAKSPVEFTQAYLSNTKFFGGEDLTKVEGLVDAVSAYIADIRNRGMKAVVADLVK
jgi:tagaturonate reductase